MIHSDVLIVGGGPAGLAAAIAAQAKGLRVTLVDSRKPPLDKPCGEGLLPDAVKALRVLGIDLDGAQKSRFRGIRFLDAASSVCSEFAGASGQGVRRTVLHRLLLDRAEAVGVNLIWGAHVKTYDSVSADVNGRRLFFGWLIGADGLNSAIRRRAGLHSFVRSTGRFAFRQHYALAPWTDFVEVHWGDDCQIIVTPTGPAEVCLALFTRDHHLRLAEAIGRFPEIARRLAGVRPTSSESGACTVLARARFVVRGNLALIGDAACSIDGIAGQGLNLAFQASLHLADALAHEDLRAYSAAHHAITRTPMRITRLMLLMAHHAWIQKKTLRMFAAKPGFFSKMMSIHAGIADADALSAQDLFDLGWRVLRA
ncbi:MAG: NAD(P)/FAD-dependent oxidoreductase [Candidatus Acidiferrales bacterium]